MTLKNPLASNAMVDNHLKCVQCVHVRILSGHKLAYVAIMHECFTYTPTLRPIQKSMYNCFVFFLTANSKNHKDILPFRMPLITKLILKQNAK